MKQGVETKRFHEEGVEQFPINSAVIKAGNRYDWYIWPIRAPDMLSNLVAAHPRHGNVGDDEIILVTTVYQFDSLITIGGYLYLKAHVSQGFAENGENLRVIID